MFNKTVQIHILVTLFITVSILFLTAEEPAAEIVDLQSRNLLHRYVSVINITGNDHQYAYIVRQIVSKIEKKMYDEPSFRLQANLLDSDTSADLPSQCLQLGSDLLIGGNYIVKEEQITINIFVYDYFKKRNTIKTSLTISTFFANELEAFADKVVSRMTRIYSDYDKTLLEQLHQIVKNSNDQERSLAENLLLQPDKLQLFTIYGNGKQYVIPVPVSKPSLVIFNDTRVAMTITLGAVTHTSDFAVMVFALPGKTKGKVEMKISVSGAKTQNLTATIGGQHDIKVIRPFFITTKEIKKHKVFLEVCSSISNMGYLGLDAKIGMGIPFNSTLENSVYFKLLVANKMFHGLEEANYFKSVKPTQLKVRFGIGYQHMFYIKKIIGIGPGFEAGFVLYWLSFVNVDGKFISFNNGINFATPSFYLSFPLTIEFLPFNRVTPIFAIEPVLRIGMRFFEYGDYQWIDPFEIDMLNYHPFRYSIDSSRTGQPGTQLHLFLYDIPFYFGVRIKI